MSKPSPLPALRVSHSSDTSTSPKRQSLRSSAPPLAGSVPEIPRSPHGAESLPRNPSPNETRARRSSTTTSQSATDAASDRGLLAPRKTSDASSSNHSASQSQSDSLRSSSSTGPPSPSSSRKVAPALALTSGRVFEDEQMYVQPEVQALRSDLYAAMWYATDGRQSQWAHRYVRYSVENM